jgi:uncharacterized protein YwqG
MNLFRRIFGVVKESTVAVKPTPASKGSEKSSVEAMRVRYGNLHRPAVHMRPGTEDGFSRLGGLPMMPADMEWPEWKGKPQAFLAQLDLGEIHRALPSCLPATGHLYFFYDQNQSVWGFDPKDAGGWRVLFHQGDAARLSERPAPAGLAPECVYKAKPVRPHRIELLPDSQNLPRADWDWRRDGAAYDELRMAVLEGENPHQVLGSPTPVQQDDMEVECQLASNGVYVGNAEGYKDPRVAALKTGATAWKLLLQLDTDDDTGWMWGDVGMLYFWVREEDAQRGDFSKVWMIFQCH